MKNLAKNLAALGIVFLLSFTTYAQTDDWYGKWRTTISGNDLEVYFTKSGDIYTGIFPNGKLDGKIINKKLVGTYTKTVNSFDRTGMGKMGEFRFVMDVNKKSFVGYYMVEGKDNWQTDNWNGQKVPIPTLEQQIEINEIKKRGETLKEYVKKNSPAPIKSWTGTWETDLFGKLKIVEKNIANVSGKYRYQAYNNKITTGDVTGKVLEDNREEFEGDFKDSDGKSGKIKIRYLNLQYETPGYDFSGSLIYNFTPEEQKMNIPLTKKVVSIKGHRVSSLQPSLINYN